MRRSLAVLLLFVLLPLASAQLPSSEATCTPGAALNATGSPRFFCEPMEAAGFLQFAQFEAGLRHLESSYPDRIEVRTIGASVEGRPLYFVEVTNEASAVPREEKLQIGYSASIHANEPAGREGMARVVEDLVAGVGPHGASLQPLLDRLIVNVWFPNPDSWATGDYFDADGIAIVHECDRGPLPLVGGPSVGYCSGFDRENAMGVDLNRQFPNPGLIHADHEPMSEPESRAVVEELRFSGNHGNLVAGMDLHGMLGSPNMIRAIIPNQDYDLRRMVLAVDMLRTIEERVASDPAFADWGRLATMDDLVEESLGQPVGERVLYADVDFEAPMAWGARWDMIGYTDTGFTSDYLMLSPRSPTGGMGAVGTITEFAYSHVIPDNKYVAKLTDMHVAGVRQMVRTQMELALRMESPVLTGTGPVGYAWVDDPVTSAADPAAYHAGQAFGRDDKDTWFDFDQVPYNVTNLRFWSDLARFSEDPIVSVDAADVDASALAPLHHFVITDQALDAMDADSLDAVRAWVEEGGHLLLTDSALRFLDLSGLTDDAARSFGVYLGHTEVADWDDPLVAGVDWDARVTGEGPAIGIQVGGDNYPQWTLDPAAVEGLGGTVVGTTTDGGTPYASLGRIPAGEGSIDFLGAALPRPVQDHAACVQCEGSDHRYGLADYSVSAFTYWIVMNSLGGELVWEPLEEPFVPRYDFDPLQAPGPVSARADEEAPGLALPGMAAACLGVALLLRARRNP